MPGRAEVGDLRILVKIVPYAVTDVFAHYSKPEAFGIFLHRVAYIAQARAFFNGFYAFEEGLPCDVYKLLRFLADGADRKRGGAIAVETLIVGADVNLDDVAVFKDAFVRGDAVDDFVVYADAGGRRKTAVSEERGFGAV